MRETELIERVRVKGNRKEAAPRAGKNASKNPSGKGGTDSEQESLKPERPMKPPRNPKGKKGLEAIILEAREALYSNWVNLAKQGSFQHLKLLLDTFPDLLVNVNPEEKRSLLELLLKQLSGGNEDSKHIGTLLGVADQGCEETAQRLG